MSVARALVPSAVALLLTAIAVLSRPALLLDLDLGGPRYVRTPDRATGGRRRGGDRGRGRSQPGRARPVAVAARHRRPPGLGAARRRRRVDRLRHPVLGTRSSRPADAGLRTGRPRPTGSWPPPSPPRRSPPASRSPSTRLPRERRRRRASCNPWSRWCVSAPTTSPVASLFAGTGAVCSVAALGRAAAASGALNASPDSDGVLRRVPLLVDPRWPHLPVARPGGGAPRLPAAADTRSGRRWHAAPRARRQRGGPRREGPAAGAAARPGTHLPAPLGRRRPGRADGSGHDDRPGRLHRRHRPRRARRRGDGARPPLPRRRSARHRRRYPARRRRQHAARVRRPDRAGVGAADGDGRRRAGPGAGTGARRGGDGGHRRAGLVRRPRPVCRRRHRGVADLRRCSG